MHPIAYNFPHFPFFASEEISLVSVSVIIDIIFVFKHKMWV